MTVSFPSVNRTMRVYNPEPQCLCGSIWNTNGCLCALSYNTEFPKDAFCLSGWPQESSPRCALEALIIAFPSLALASILPVTVLLFTQLWTRWPPWESASFLASQGLQYFHLFLKTSFPHIQGLVSFSVLWLHNLAVVFLYLLYFKREKKNPQFY